MISKLSSYRMFPIFGTALIAVAMFLLSRLGAGSPVWVAALYSVVLGLGLGFVMQVLVLAVQNAVKPAVMGVATVGSTMMRQVGGSIGVSIFGAIFTNRLHHELSVRVSKNAHIPKTVNPAAIETSPADRAHGVRRQLRSRATSGVPIGSVHLGDRIPLRALVARGAAALAPAERRRSPRDANRRMTLDPRIDIGHVHLKVSNLDRARDFWVGVLGFDLMTRVGGEASQFVSAGGYHHHIGLNTWESQGGSPPPRNTTGLYHVAMRFPDRKTLAEAVKRVVECPACRSKAPPTTV